MSGPNLLAFTHAVHHTRAARRRRWHRAATRGAVVVLAGIAMAVAMAWCAAT
jgi:hypothetical protein